VSLSAAKHPCLLQKNKNKQTNQQTKGKSVRVAVKHAFWSCDPRTLKQTAVLKLTCVQHWNKLEVVAHTFCCMQLFKCSSDQLLLASSKQPST
jgi:hypothetical protein